MTKVNELKDDELKTVTGGVLVNGIEYKYSIGTKLICCGVIKSEELVINEKNVFSLWKPEVIEA